MSGVVTPSPPPAPARVLVLARRSEDLPPAPPWRPDLAVVLVAGAGDPPHDDLPYAVEVVRADPPDGWEARGRAGLAAARTGWQSLRSESSPAWTWALKRSTWLRREARGADLVWSLDTDTDAVLSLLPGLTQGTPAVLSRDAAELWSALHDLDAVVEELALLTEAEPLEPEEVTERVRRWQAVAARVAATHAPGVLLPVEALAAAGRRLGASVGPAAAPTVLTTVLDLPGLPGRARGRTGLAAQRAAVDLRTAGGPQGRPSEDELTKAARAALTGADEALAAGDGPLALARLGDAMALLFHRERHAEVPWSPLVADPRRYLRPLTRSATFQALLDRPRPRRRPRRVVDRRPRVLVVTGAYGDFHEGVVEALQDEADVRVRNLVGVARVLGRKSMDSEVLRRLSALLVAQGGTGLPGVPDETADDARDAAAVAKVLGWADVVFTDWADRATVWVSHLALPRTRLVVRVHSLDALDPWIHLVNWAAVDEVVVVSEPLRSLVTDLLQLHRARTTVTVLPNLVPLRALPVDKDPRARTTLGMIGWGRPVKDPLWALDLLERDPSWELVLVGHDFPEAAVPRTARYAAEFRRRAASPSMRDRVHVVGWADDVGEPLRRVGVMLSCSVREAWHVGLVEGAASGSVPVVRDWPLFAARGGARSLFPDDWVVDDLDAAEARVRWATDPERWEQERLRARETALGLFDPDAAAQRYREVVLGPYLPAEDRDPAVDDDDEDRRAVRP